MNKIFFFDIDGTILKKNSSIVDKKTVYAIKELLKQGNQVYIATGKSLGDALYIAKQIEVTNLITSNGQVISEGRNIKEANYFSDELKLKIVNVSNEKKILLGVQTNFHNYILNVFEDDEKLKNSESYNNLLNFLDEVSIEVPPIIHDLENLEDITQFWVLDSDKLSFEGLEVKYLPWVSTGVDLVMNDADKIKSVKKVAKSIDAGTEILAFGDGYNDIKMLKYADRGIAMGNASLEVKSIANEITDSVDEEGIYNFLVKNDMIEEM